MKDYSIAMLSAFFAGVIVMILHEFPKSLYLYFKVRHDPTVKAELKINLKHTVQLWRYIDPLGLIFCVMSNAGFSKNPFITTNGTYDREINKKVSIIGFISLVVQFSISVVILKFVFDMNDRFVVKHTNTSFLFAAFMYLCTYVAIVSMSMLITNCVPFRNFNLSLYMISKNADREQNIRKYENKVMVFLLLAYFVRIVSKISANILLLFL